MCRGSIVRCRHQRAIAVLLGSLMVVNNSCCPAAPLLPEPGTYTISGAEDPDIANGEARIEDEELTIRYISADRRSVVVVFKIYPLAK